MFLIRQELECGNATGLIIVAEEYHFFVDPNSSIDKTIKQKEI